MSQTEEVPDENPNSEENEAGKSSVDAAAAQTTETAAATAAATATANDLQVRRVIVETMTQEELDYFRSIRDYLSTLKQPDRERWIIMEMQKFRAEVEEERRSSDDIMIPPGNVEEEALDAEPEEGEEEETSAEDPQTKTPQTGKSARQSTEIDADASPTDGLEVPEAEPGDGLTDEERAFQAFLADEAKKCLNCKRYCHMEGHENFLYLPCTLCEKRICHLCKRFCYKCGELVCLNCIFTKPKSGRKYCPHCFNDTRLNDRVLKCEICFFKVEIDERIISCWRCYSVACMKTCGRYSNDGFICRRCINDLKEQEEQRLQEDAIDHVGGGPGDDLNANNKNMMKVKRSSGGVQSNHPSNTHASNYAHRHTHSHAHHRLSNQ